MPYKNIVYIKLEKRLLNDHRWFTMPEGAQLLYIKLILAAAETYNMLPKSVASLQQVCRIRGRKDYFKKNLECIKSNFPKFKETPQHYYFEEFEEKTNYIYPDERKPQGNPKETPNIVEDSIVKNSITASPALQAALKDVFNKGFNIYKLLNRLKKTSKTAVRLPDEVLLKVCQSYLNNKTPIDNEWAWFTKVVVSKWHEYNAEKNINENKKWKDPSSISKILFGK